jgi:hypothetical protein
MCCFSQRLKRPGGHCVENLAGTGDAPPLCDITRCGKTDGTNGKLFWQRAGQRALDPAFASEHSANLPAERKGLDEALAYLRPEDTFVVWKLD